MQLSDNTKVWLNSESQLKISCSVCDGKTRQVELMMKPISKFLQVLNTRAQDLKVKTKIQNVEFIGTEFNVKDYKGEANIYTRLVKSRVAISNTATKQISTKSAIKFKSQNNNINITTVDVYSEFYEKKR